MAAAATSSISQTGEVRVTANPLPGQQNQPTPSSRCSCCSRRTIRWQQGVSLSGVAFDAAVLAVSVLKVSSIWEAVATAGESALIHLFSTASLFVWQPRRDLEKTVAQARRVEQKVGIEASALQKGLTQLRIITKQQEQQLASERLFSLQFKGAVEEKIIQISSLTTELEGMKKGLEEAQVVAALWKSATNRLSEQLNKMHTKNIEDDVKGLGKQILSLKGSKEIFERDIQAFASQSDAIQQTRASYGRMLEQIASTFQGLSSNIESKKTLLSAAEQEISKLRSEITQLQGIKIDFDSLKDSYEKLSREFAKASQDLERIIPILQNPEFLALIERLSTAKK